MKNMKEIEKMRCEDCGLIKPDVSYRPNAYANDVGNDSTAMHTVCNNCDAENAQDI